MFGHDEYLHFPLLTYATQQAVALEDPFDLSVGLIDIRSGQSVAQLLSRLIPGQTPLFLPNTIINLNITRIPLDSFRFRGPLYFAQRNQWRVDSRLQRRLLRYLQHIPVPVTRLHQAESGGGRRLWFRAQPLLALSGHQDLRPAQGEQEQLGQLCQFFQPAFQFQLLDLLRSLPWAREHWNTPIRRSTSSNGTFHMENLSSVTCTNSKNSVKGGWAITICWVTIVGYGTWSRDLTNGRHVVMHCTGNDFAPDLPYYVSVQIRWRAHCSKRMLSRPRTPFPEVVPGGKSRARRSIADSEKFDLMRT